MSSKKNRNRKSGQGSTQMDYLDKLSRIEAKTDHQEDLMDSIDDNEITFAVGPAGTGKTFLSLACALRLIKKPRSKYKKLIIARPQVPTKKMGFLPGDEKDKNAPYMRPIFYTIEKIIGGNMLKKLQMENRVEGMTLEYMRGISIDNTIVLLDEAQNLSKSEILMFLTRLGEYSKFIITGDLDQHDLKEDISGLQVAVDRLKGIRGIGMVKLEEGDIVRNPLIKKIITRFNQPVKPVSADSLWKGIKNDYDSEDEYYDEEEEDFIDDEDFIKEV